VKARFPVQPTKEANAVTESIRSNHKNRFQKPISEGGGDDYVTANANTADADVRDIVIDEAVAASTGQAGLDQGDAAKAELKK
jgi:hypothetical protein